MERTHATNVGNKVTSQRTAELQCTTLATMSVNNGRMTHHMTGIKTSINKDAIKDGTIKIGHSKDMSKGIDNQQHRHSHHHQHRQHQQAWHSPSAQWRTSTLHSNTSVHQPDWTTTSNRRKHHDRQWCSNPRQSTMVWNIISTQSDEATRQTHPEDSDRNRFTAIDGFTSSTNEDNTW